MTAYSLRVNAVTEPYVYENHHYYLMHDFWPPHPQPHPPLLRTCTCSASLLPASRWVGWRLLLPVVMGTLSATLWPIKRLLGRTKSAMRWWTSQPMPLAMCFRAWRSGHFTMCGLKPIQMSGQALRAAAPRSERRRMVRFLTCLENLSTSFKLLTKSFHLLKIF